MHYSASDWCAAAKHAYRRQIEQRRVSQSGHLGAVDKDAVLALLGLVRQRHEHGHVMPPAAAARTTTDLPTIVFFAIHMFRITATVVVLIVVRVKQQQRRVREPRLADKESARVIKQQRGRQQFGRRVGVEQQTRSLWQSTER